jgi:CheY-like chemotaxis protein
MQKVLVADDQQLVRKIIVATLSKVVDCEVLEATDGAQALHLIRHERPALVLLDIDMPRLNGYEVACAMKADPATRDIPVLFVSGSSPDEVHGYALALGAAGVLTKPFSPQALREVVQKLLGT